MRNLLFSLILLGLCSVWSFAGDKAKAEHRSITGCLAQGDSADEFVLKGTDGSTWNLKSETVSLAPHVGHEVTATGNVSNPTMHNMKEDAKETAKDAGMKKSDAEEGNLKVTGLKMVSESCK